MYVFPGTRFLYNYAISSSSKNVNIMINLFLDFIHVHVFLLTRFIYSFSFPIPSFHGCLNQENIRQQNFIMLTHNHVKKKHPFKPYYCIVKLKFTRVYIIIIIFALNDACSEQKKNIYIYYLKSVILFQVGRPTPWQQYILAATEDS